MMTVGLVSSSSRVIVQDGQLILTLHDAENPVIWQIERSVLKTAGFDVAANGEWWHLRFKPMNDNPRDIAVFKDRKDAVAVLSDIQNALMSKKEKSARFEFGESLSPERRHIVLAALSVVLFVTLVSMLFRLVPAPVTTAAAPSATSSGFGAPSGEAGIPQSADDLLNAQGGTP